MNQKEQSCSRYCFGIPLDKDEAERDISARKKALATALTTGYEVLVFLLKSRMEVCDTTTALCIHPKTDATFEISPPYLGGNNIPQCCVGINFLWSMRDQEKFRLEAATSFDSWLLEYAAYLGNRLEPRCPQIWLNVFQAEPLTSIVGDFMEVQRNSAQIEKDKKVCSTCRIFRKDFGICCIICHSWSHLGCLDTSHTSGVDKEDLPKTYVCACCQKA